MEIFTGAPEQTADSRLSSGVSDAAYPVVLSMTSEEIPKTKSQAQQISKIRICRSDRV